MLSAVEQSRHGCVDIWFIGEAFKMGKMPLFFISGVQLYQALCQSSGSRPPHIKKLFDFIRGAFIINLH